MLFSSVNAPVADDDGAAGQLGVDEFGGEFAGARPRSRADELLRQRDLDSSRRNAGAFRDLVAGVPATGTDVRAESMGFYRLLDGKIVEEPAQLDMLGLLQQMDAVPTA